MGAIGPPPRFLRSEVLCLGIVTFEQGVAWQTGSYSMAVRPVEEHPCDLNRKWNAVYRLYIGLSEVFALLFLSIIALSSPSAHSKMFGIPSLTPLILNS